MANQVQTRNQNKVGSVTINSLLKQDVYKKRFNELLGKKAPGFISSIINVSNLPSLKDADPNTIISSAVVAASLDLPIDQNLGFAYIVPYNKKNEGKKAQFQMGYKGYIQLAMRTSQYKTINAIEVYEGEIKRVNRLTGEVEFNEDESLIDRDNVVGYIAYFKLVNGFEKTLYMSKEEMEKHAKTYSQSYRSTKDWVVRDSLWTTSFDDMAIKTILKRLLSKYGILSIDMQTAITSDQAAINEDGSPEYVDNEVAQEIEEKANSKELDFESDNVVDAEYKEVKEEKEEPQQATFEEPQF